MGELTAQAGASAELTRHDPAVASSLAPASDFSHHASGPPLAYAAPRQPQHEQAASAQHAFNSQIDMTYQHRAGSFDMSAIAQALPHGHYRSQPYGQSQQRYSPAAVPLSTGHYGAPQALGAMSGQQYYLPHHAPIPQFYQTPLSSQSPATMAPRHEMGYYPTQVVVSQPPVAATPFYYTTAASFPGQPTHFPGPAGMRQ